LTEEYISITFDDKPGVGGSGVSSGLSNAADVILSANRNVQEVAVERAIRNANQAFDAEFDKRVESINDGIEQAKAEAERYADQIKTEISQEFDAFEQEYQVTKQSQRGWAKTSFSHIKNEQFQLGVARFPLHAL
ncbi:hypothetical protein, partial [Streptococcus suis]|uniref:hypothetical protein n=1 Tax=Streptococcus suis TaxID=1307 RepID=UPI002ED2E31F